MKRRGVDPCCGKWPGAVAGYAGGCAGIGGPGVRGAYREAANVSGTSLSRRPSWRNLGVAHVKAVERTMMRHVPGITGK